MAAKCFNFILEVVELVLCEYFLYQKGESTPTATVRELLLTQLA